MSTVITFAANVEGNPLNAMAADFWAGEATLRRSWDGRGWTADVQFVHKVAALCARYGVKTSSSLHSTSVGCPVLPVAYPAPSRLRGIPRKSRAG
jgi:hypothetical protein